MAKVNIYFQDLSKEKQEELWVYLREQFEDEIKDQTKDSGIDKETITNEILNDYINTHDSGMEFEI